MNLPALDEFDFAVQVVQRSQIAGDVNKHDGQDGNHDHRRGALFTASALSRFRMLSESQKIWEVRIDFHCTEPEAGTARNEKSGRTRLSLIEPFVRGSSSNSQRQAIT